MHKRFASLAAAAALVPAVLLAETKVTWYGHAAFRIETPSGGVILIDPWLKSPTNPNKNATEELANGRVDYILLTHGHADHVGQTVEIGKKTGAVLVSPYGLSFNMKSVLGYPEQQATLATSGNVGGTFDLPKAKAKVTMVQAIHGSDITVPTLPTPPAGAPTAISGGNPVGFVIEIEGGPTIYHTGDTFVHEDMKLIGEFHKVDIMLACIGGHFTMAPAHAALAAQYVKAKQVVPMHYGTFGLLAGTPDQLKQELAKRKVDAKVTVVKPGETVSF